jgi:AcrR family transcriptional regulator
LPAKQQSPRRQSIVAAAFAVLMEKGYAGASTLEIARRARVSKRELYAEFGSKAGILEALIAETAAQMQVPLTSADVADRASFVAALTAYGNAALGELSGPHVVAINRLAAAEAGRSSELGKILDTRGREPNRRALVAIIKTAQEAGILKPDEEPDIIAGHFFALLTGDLLLRLMLGVMKRPTAREIARRAEAATTAILRLHGV